MTREEFIEILKKRRYSYEMEGDKIMVTHGGGVILSSLETIPPGVHFENDGSVYLNSLKSISPGVHFKNRGDVWLRDLETISPGVHFENDEDIYLKGLGWVNDNEGIRIEGVENRKLLHLMIKQGVFI